MQQKGVLYTCDRCGATAACLYDASFGRYDEKAVDGWSCTGQCGDLCPSCTQHYKEIIAAFRDGSL